MVVTADMVDVFLISSIPHKGCHFTSRFVLYNETCAPVGLSTKSGVTSTPTVCHEGTAGNDASDVASSFQRIVKDDLTILLDN